LHVRLKQHEATALKLAHWLQARPEVARVMHPAFPGSPGHDIWKRDFTGSSGLFAVELKPVAQKALAAMFDGMELFGMGWSWGGYESLMVTAHPLRTASQHTGPGPIIRFHAGLEDAGDLIADLEAGFARLGAAA
jgi:cystathionine beta-lyase